jgi:ATP-dependent Clp protease ATP-binding subunit ClpX
MMAGAKVRLFNGQYIDTIGLLFIGGGAFVGQEKIMSNARTCGFASTSQNDNKTILDRLNARGKPTDLFRFGLIPEFTGRLPIIARFHDLTRDMMVRILAEPKNRIHSQYVEIFLDESVELVDGPKVFEQIAGLAVGYEAGARSPRGIFEELITPVLYAVTDDLGISRVEIETLFTEPRYIRKP